MISTDDAFRVARLALSRVSRRKLELPGEDEREPNYTARVLMPIVRDALVEIDAPGLTLHGDGEASAPATVLPSCEFRPDIALLYQNERVTAFEVKFLRLKNRQSSLSAAIGQSVVYRTNGYKAVGTILLDLAPVADEATAITKVLNSLNLICGVFCKDGRKLTIASMT